MNLFLSVLKFDVGVIAGLLEYVKPPARFVVEVKPFHMLRYCHGVVINLVL